LPGLVFQDNDFVLSPPSSLSHIYQSYR